MTKSILKVLVAMASAGAPVSAAELRTDIPYAEVAGEPLLLDAMVPRGDGPFPVAIYVHGGGWGTGDKQLNNSPIFEPLGEAGVTWFSINYRLAPKHRWPACIDDVRTAIRWVKEHAAEYKGDPERIVIMGHSAGGHLAAFAAVTADDDTRVQGAVIFAGPTDLEADCERRGQVSPALQALFDRSPEIDQAARQQLRETSPINHLRSGLPPFLLIHGTADQSVPYKQSVNLQSQLRELGVPCELVTIEGGPHSMEVWDTIDASYKEKFVDWLRKTVGENE